MANPPAVPDPPTTQATRPMLSKKHLLATVGFGLLVVVLVVLAVGVIFRPDDHNAWADLIRSAALALGLVAAVPAGYVAYRKQQTTEAEHELDQRKERQRQVEHDDANERATTKDFRDRYTAAATQIGSDKAPIRLAGVYALAQLADEWGLNEADQRQTCIDVLCSYLRMPWPLKAPNDASEQERLDKQRLRDEETRVRETILRVIVTHLHEDRAAESGWHENDFDFTGAELPDVEMPNIRLNGAFIAKGATFSGDALFAGATFSGDAQFDSVTFSRAAWFNGVEFSKGAQFDGASFSEAAWFNGVKFSKTAEAAYSGAAWFNGVKFSKGAHFDMASFSGDAQFANVTFSGDARFDSVTFSGDAQFDNVTFSMIALFRGAIFFGVCWFNGAVFSWTAQFDSASFVSAARFDTALFTRPPIIRGATISGQLIRTDLSQEAVTDQARPFQPYVPAGGEVPPEEV